MKFPGGDAAECHIFQSMLCRQFQTGAVAGCQFLPVPAGNTAMNHRANRVKHIPGGKVIPFCQLGTAIGFRMALGLHHLIALVPKLKASR